LDAKEWLAGPAGERLERAVRIALGEPAAALGQSEAVALQGGFGAIVTATPTVHLLLLYIGVFCTAINFGLWFWSLKYVSAARAAPIQYLSTPLSVALAWWILGEPLTIGLAIGTLLVLVGVFLTQSGRRRRREGV
jgi:drug/metabolite transporter (DMT)-like permease